MSLKRRKNTKTSSSSKGREVLQVGELLPQTEFLKQKKISIHDFKHTGLSWEDLKVIYNDYVSLKPKLEHSAKAVVDILFSKAAQEKGVHSVRFRIKDAGSLIEKIVNKKIEDPNRNITIDTYREQITDLIGVRALHVFKFDIYGIHNFITEMFAFKRREKPIIYYREGDDNELVKMCVGMGCTKRKHKKGYRSVHYIVSTQLTKENYYVEIQVRTIFEEGWSEIDHKIRYFYKSESGTLFDGQLNTLNRICGNADEIGSEIKNLEQKEQQKILTPKRTKK